MKNSVVDHRPQFYRVQNQVLDDFGAEMGPTGVAVYNALCRFANQDGDCYPSVKTIGDKVGISSKVTVRTYLRKLSDLGLITIEERTSEEGDPTTNIYHLHYYAPKGGSKAEGVGDNLTQGRSKIDSGVDQKLSPNNTNSNKTNLTSSSSSSKPPSKPPKVAEFTQVYERVWGMMVSSPFIGDQIAEWAGKVTLEGWEYALKESAKANARNWKYLEKVLDRVEREGHETGPKEVAQPPESESRLSFTVEDILANKPTVRGRLPDERNNRPSRTSGDAWPS